MGIAAFYLSICSVKLMIVLALIHYDAQNRLGYGLASSLQTTDLWSGILHVDTVYIMDLVTVT
jgi:hypothetical protein